VAENKSPQLVLETHGGTFQLPDDWQRFRDWADSWRRAAERNPRHRPENDSVDDFLREAMEFCLGVKGWQPDAFWKMTPQEYDAALAGHMARHQYEARREPGGATLEAGRRVLAALYGASIPDRATIDNKPLYAAMCKAGFTGSYSTAMRAAERRPDRRK
jgi:hypothetical protein